LDIFRNKAEEQFEGNLKLTLDPTVALEVSRIKVKVFSTQGTTRECGPRDAQYLEDLGEFHFLYPVLVQNNTRLFGFRFEVS
jgi:hypothetical protein